MKILIIDDEKWKREFIIESILEVNQEAEIKECECRNDGLKVLKDNDFDLLFLDMRFPNHLGGMVERDNGLFVLRELKRIKNNIPVVICSSGYTDCSEYNIQSYILFGSNATKEQIQCIVKDFNSDKKK